MCDDIIARAMLEQHLKLSGTPEESAPDWDAETSPGGVAIEVNGLRKAFGSNVVLRNLDLVVPAGEFLTIVGKSGCGKSTLLRVLAGLDRPTAGEIHFNGVPAGYAEHVSRLMFQEPRLLPWSRVLGNVAVGLGDQRGTPAGERRALAKLAEVGLESRAHDWPSVLSGGQKQRVAPARALASRPQFLALDEPLGALDALTRIEMQDLVERIWLEEDFTAVLVTHDVTEAIVLGDRVALIEDGVIKLDLYIDLPRPRRRGTPAVAALEEEILGQLFDDTGKFQRRAAA